MMMPPPPPPPNARFVLPGGAGDLKQCCMCAVVSSFVLLDFPTLCLIEFCGWPVLSRASCVAFPLADLRTVRRLFPRTWCTNALLVRVDASEVTQGSGCTEHNCPKWYALPACDSARHGRPSNDDGRKWVCLHMRACVTFLTARYHWLLLLWALDDPYCRYMCRVFPTCASFSYATSTSSLTQSLAHAFTHWLCSGDATAASAYGDAAPHDGDDGASRACPACAYLHFLDIVSVVWSTNHPRARIQGMRPPPPHMGFRPPNFQPQQQFNRPPPYGRGPPPPRGFNQPRPQQNFGGPPPPPGGMPPPPPGGPPRPMGNMPPPPPGGPPRPMGNMPPPPPGGPPRPMGNMPPPPPGGPPRPMGNMPPPPPGGPPRPMGNMPPPPPGGPPRQMGNMPPPPPGMPPLPPN